jgi:hypothetical protein
MDNRRIQARWIMQSTLMIPIAILFLSTPFVVPNRGNWIGNVIGVSPGVLILYVEGWLWWHRLTQHVP